MAGSNQSRLPLKCLGMISRDPQYRKSIFGYRWKPPWKRSRTSYAVMECNLRWISCGMQNDLM
ncbi:dynein heavy chain [Histoplasma ohiense]|uniref:Dynein heavy chain n=1 Tax=Ajellomyces capsulatus (strain H88) TaxID=544711 RepID=A0A8A1LSF0_AJEC8|nr:dynein heavy chain [Histoplasma ohiense (nom. inval.)]QSS55354.1 dynein heavy chain [Histoplasma capsulatum var. duboisii H88]